MGIQNPYSRGPTCGRNGLITASPMHEQNKKWLVATDFCLVVRECNFLLSAINVSTKKWYNRTIFFCSKRKYKKKPVLDAILFRCRRKCKTLYHRVIFLFVIKVSTKKIVPSCSLFLW